MSLPKITSVTGTAVHVPGDDIDTDRIIPARYLKCVTFEDLAGTHFHDVRFDPDGSAGARGLSWSLFVGATLTFFWIVQGLGLRFCRDWCPSGVYFGLLGQKTVNGIELSWETGVSEGWSVEESPDLQIPWKAMQGQPSLSPNQDRWILPVARILPRNFYRLSK